MRFHNETFRRTMHRAPAALWRSGAMGQTTAARQGDGRTDAQLSSYSGHAMDAGPLAGKELGSDSNPSPFEPIYALSRPEFGGGRCRLADPSLFVTGGVHNVQYT